MAIHRGGDEPPRVTHVSTKGRLPPLRSPPAHYSDLLSPLTSSQIEQGLIQSIRRILGVSLLGLPKSHIMRTLRPYDRPHWSDVVFKRHTVVDKVYLPWQFDINNVGINWLCSDGSVVFCPLSPSLDIAQSSATILYTFYHSVYSSRATSLSQTHSISQPY